MTGTPTPEWLVERLHAGDLPPDQAAQVRARLEAEEGGLARLEALAKDDAALRAVHPPGPVLAEIRRRAGAPAPRREASRRIFLLLPALAGVAAAALLVVKLGVVQPGQGGRHETEQLKGNGPRLVAARERPGLEAEPLPSGTRARAGDVLQLSYLSAGRPYGVVLSIDGRGTVTRHWPESGDGAAPLEARGAVPLAHAYILDDAPTFERFFLVTGNTAFAVQVPLEAARHLAASGAARTAPLGLPAGLEQTTLLLEKLP
jgi:hypothetical protein